MKKFEVTLKDACDESHYITEYIYSDDIDSAWKRAQDEFMTEYIHTGGERGFAVIDIQEC